MDFCKSWNLILTNTTTTEAMYYKKTWDLQQFRDFCLKSGVDSIICEFQDLKVSVPIYLKF